MTKTEADELTNALQRIESGQVDLGVTLLRSILRDAGYPAPPFIVPARERPPRNKER
ncbi:MAG TPA: hypothetical protein VKY24_00755 [Reyranella sp.]|nr:hypothetical protein [Reyranella sp.]